jgi:Mg/Co/Ni transporter MgtE
MNVTQTLAISPEAIAEMLDRNDTDPIRAALRHEHAVDIAGLLGELPRESVAQVLLCLPEAKQATIFGYFDHETQVALASVLERAEMARIFGAMAHDERADLFAGLTEEQRNALLPGLAQAEREDLRKLASYPAGTVGSVMTSDYATLSPDLTTVQAMERLRHVAAVPAQPVPAGPGGGLGAAGHLDRRCRGRSDLFRHGQLAAGRLGCCRLTDGGSGAGRPLQAPARSAAGCASARFPC